MSAPTDKQPTVAELLAEIRRLDLALDLQGRKLAEAIRRLDAFDAFVERPRRKGIKS